MDAVIDITNADKGFLILLEGDELAGQGRAQPASARTSPTRSSQLSDSIVEQGGRDQAGR